MGSGILILLIAVGLVGMLPLFLVLRRYYIKSLIKKHGATAAGYISSIKPLRGKQGFADLITYYFYDNAQQAYSGVFRAKAHKYKRNHEFIIYYYAAKPRWHTIAGEDKLLGFLIFVIALAVFVWFAAYKLYVEINS